MAGEGLVAVGNEVWAQPTVVVTGSSTGIGKAVALRLAPEYHVVVNARIGVDDGARTVAEIVAAGGSADFVQADVSTDGGVAELRVRAFPALP